MQSRADVSFANQRCAGSRCSVPGEQHYNRIVIEVGARFYRDGRRQTTVLPWRCWPTRIWAYHPAIVYQLLSRMPLNGGLALYSYAASGLTAKRSYLPLSTWPSCCAKSLVTVVIAADGKLDENKFGAFIGRGIAAGGLITPSTLLPQLLIFPHDSVRIAPPPLVYRGWAQASTLMTTSWDGNNISVETTI